MRVHIPRWRAPKLKDHKPQSYLGTTPLTTEDSGPIGVYINGDVYLLLDIFLNYLGKRWNLDGPGLRRFLGYKNISKAIAVPLTQLGNPFVENSSSE